MVLSIPFWMQQYIRFGDIYLEELIFQFLSGCNAFDTEAWINQTDNLSIPFWMQRKKTVQIGQFEVEIFQFLSGCNERLITDEFSFIYNFQFLSGCNWRGNIY
ncbi:hypothetical protein DFR86_11435 [Acidianus sulfidivorans JP7]|nr:hypothetical protein [Acidianus sulfidivorans]AWR98087.2 hypothetical protein DFR86_11435 [Acidianus sulfidivorans JP7]